MNENIRCLNKKLATKFHFVNGLSLVGLSLVGSNLVKLSFNASLCNKYISPQMRCKFILKTVKAYVYSYIEIANTSYI